MSIPRDLALLLDGYDLDPVSQLQVRTTSSLDIWEAGM